MEPSEQTVSPSIQVAPDRSALRKSAPVMRAPVKFAPLRSERNSRARRRSARAKDVFREIGLCEVRFGQAGTVENAFRERCGDEFGAMGIDIGEIAVLQIRSVESRVAQSCPA